MTVKILDRSGELLAEFDVENIRGAHLRGANLTGANLSLSKVAINCSSWLSMKTQVLKSFSNFSRTKPMTICLSEP